MREVEGTTQLVYVDEHNRIIARHDWIVMQAALCNVNL